MFILLYFCLQQYANPAYERLFGYTCDELLGKNVQELLYSDKDQADLQDTMYSQLRKGKVMTLFHVM